MLFRVQTERVSLNDLQSLALLRAELARLEYSAEDIDGMVEPQLKIMEKPTTPSIADLEPLVMVRNLLTDSEAETYTAKLDEIIAWVSEKLLDEARIEQRVQ